MNNDQIFKNLKKLCEPNKTYPVARNVSATGYKGYALIIGRYDGFFGFNKTVILPWTVAKN